MLILLIQKLATKPGKLLLKISLFIFLQNLLSGGVVDESNGMRAVIFHFCVLDRIPQFLSHADNFFINHFKHLF